VRSVTVYLEDPSSYEYIAEDVRPHLAQCVRMGQFHKFPFVRHCICEGQAGGRMVACDACDRWHHLGCIGSSVVKDDQWLCDACK